MKEWIYHQITDVNIISIIIIFAFVTAMSKANTQKLLKEQSQELYNELEELKDEIREGKKY
jgi:ABC-type transporter MlaC component